MSSAPASHDAGRSAPARIRTYHARRGRLSAAHRAALERLADRWSLTPTGEVIDGSVEFGRCAPLVLDIGSGMGESTRAQAAAEPEVDVIALDVHTRGVATLLRGIEADGVENVRVVLGDAVVFVDQRLAEGSLAGARIYFPDPWPKARHAKRRLVQPEFVALLASRLCPGGFVHCATDDGNYAEQMRQVLMGEQSLRLRPDPPPGARRPTTKYERRAERLGHRVVDIWATRTLSP